MPDSSLKQEDLAQLYRDLRKSREDEKNEPGAADFYYGEMEMRRRSDPWGTRLLLTAYWAVSGYGLRPLRSLLTLAILVVVTTFALNAYGIEETSPVTPLARVPVLGIELEIDMVQAEHNTIPSLIEVFLFVIGSLVSVATLDTEILTTAGQATRVVLRFLGPVLLGLTVLAVRGRVKR